MSRNSVITIVVNRKIERDVAKQLRHQGEFLVSQKFWYLKPQGVIVFENIPRCILEIGNLLNFTLDTDILSPFVIFIAIV